MLYVLIMWSQFDSRKGHQGKATLLVAHMPIKKKREADPTLDPAEGASWLSFIDYILDGGIAHAHCLFVQHPNPAPPGQLSSGLCEPWWCLQQKEMTKPDLSDTLLSTMLIVLKRPLQACSVQQQFCL